MRLVVTISICCLAVFGFCQNEAFYVSGHGNLYKYDCNLNLTLNTNYPCEVGGGSSPIVTIADQNGDLALILTYDAYTNKNILRDKDCNEIYSDSLGLTKRNAFNIIGVPNHKDTYILFYIDVIDSFTKKLCSYDIYKTDGILCIHNPKEIYRLNTIRRTSAWNGGNSYNDLAYNIVYKPGSSHFWLMYDNEETNELVSVKYDGLSQEVSFANYIDPNSFAVDATVLEPTDASPIAIDVAPLGNKIAVNYSCIGPKYANHPNLIFFDFDNNTGGLSNSKTVVIANALSPPQIAYTRGRGCFTKSGAYYYFKAASSFFGSLHGSIDERNGPILRYKTTGTLKEINESKEIVSNFVKSYNFRVTPNGKMIMRMGKNVTDLLPPYVALQNPEAEEVYMFMYDTLSIIPYSSTFLFPIHYCYGGEYFRMHDTKDACELGYEFKLLDVENIVSTDWSIDNSTDTKTSSSDSFKLRRNFSETGIYTMKISAKGTGEEVYTSHTNVCIDHINAQPLRDSFVCGVNTVSVELEANKNSIVWFDGDTNPIKGFTDSGTYIVEVSRPGCSYSDTITISRTDTIPVEILGDSVICTESMVNLSSSIEADFYTWSTGQNSKEIEIYEPGEVILQILKNTTCFGIDTLDVKLKDVCASLVHYPNGFTPNGDNLNESFKPVFYNIDASDVFSTDLKIYNRWGELIYATSDMKMEWIPDSTIPQGVYFYQGNINTRSKKYSDSGTITLLR